MTVSIYMTIALAHERHFAIKSPVYYNHLLHTTTSKNQLRRFLCYLIPILIGSILYNIPKFREFTISDNNVQPTNLVNQLSYRNHYQNWCALFVLGIIPYTSLICLNMRIGMNLKNQKDTDNLMLDNSNRTNSPRPYGLDHISLQQNYKTTQEEKLSAKILMGVVTLFLICHSIRVFNNLNTVMIWNNYVKCKEAGRYPGIHVWQHHLTILGSVFTVIYSAINMPLYYILNIKFRKKMLPTQHDSFRHHIIKNPAHTLNEVKGEPDGASEPILSEGRRLSDFSGTSLISTNLKNTEHFPKTSSKLCSIPKNIKSTDVLNHSDTKNSTAREENSEIIDLNTKEPKTSKASLKKQITIEKSFMTPLVAKQNMLDL